MTEESSRHQFDASNARCDVAATVTVFRDRTGAVVLGLQPWATQVRFSAAQFGALVDHLDTLRTDR